MPPTSGLPDCHNTSTAGSIILHCMSVSSGLHHLGLSLVFGRLHLPIHSVILSPFRPYHHSWQSGCRLHLVPRTVSLGRVHLGLSMLLHNSV